MLRFLLILLLLSGLHADAVKLFEKNRVFVERGGEVFTYHAPFLGEDIAQKMGFFERLKEPWLTLYPHQWFFDSCLNSIALLHIDPELSKEEIRSLLVCQREDGFIPHLIWNPRRKTWADRMLSLLWLSPNSSPYLGPPIIAEAVLRIYERTRDRDFLLETLPKIKAYYRYIGRRARDSSIPPIIISYESGKDRSREYETPYGGSLSTPVWKGPIIKLMLHHSSLLYKEPLILKRDLFEVKDLFFSSLYAINLKSLSKLCEYAGDPDSAYFSALSSRVEEEILKEMWDEEEGAFFSLYKGEKIKVLNASTFLPLLFEKIEPYKVERLVKEHLLKDFWTNYPVPYDPYISSDIDWRGKQTWIVINWYVVRGLEDKGYNKLAEIIKERSIELVMREGFREWYDSETGEGGGALEFTPSALILEFEGER